MGESSTFNTIRIKGKVETVGAVSATILQRDSSKFVTHASGLTIPTDGAAGYAKGCIFIKTNVGAGVRSLYENQGSSSSSQFVPVDAFSSIVYGVAAFSTTAEVTTACIAPTSGVLVGADFSGLEALAAHDTNYATFSIVNYGQAGAGSTAMLAAANANTTKVTGGSALVANGKRALTLHGTAANLVVVEGDRLSFVVTPTGTLANTVTKCVVSLRFRATS